MEIGHRDKSVLEIRQNGIKLKGMKQNQTKLGNETKSEQEFISLLELNRIQPMGVLIQAFCKNNAIKEYKFWQERENQHKFEL